MTLQSYISHPLTLAGCDVWKVTSVPIQIPLDLSPWVQIFSWMLFCCRYTAKAWSVWLKPAVARFICSRWVSKINHSKEFTLIEKAPQEGDVSWQNIPQCRGLKVPLTPQREVKSQAVLHVPGKSWTDEPTHVSTARAQPRVSQQERPWKEKTAYFLENLSLPLKSASHEYSRHHSHRAPIWTLTVFKCFPALNSASLNPSFIQALKTVNFIFDTFHSLTKLSWPTC